MKHYLQKTTFDKKPFAICEWEVKGKDKKATEFTRNKKLVDCPRCLDIIKFYKSE